VSSDEATVLLEIRDDGVGLPPSGIDKRDEGHLGLRLLIDAAQDLGGEMRVSSGVDGGTTVWLELPNAAPSAHEQ
jgi:nitrate/nitrite-specific signal transduction histidine kinase